MTIGYTVPEIWHMMDTTVIFDSGIFFALLPFFCFLFLAILGSFTLLAAQEVKISKQWKKQLEISFYTYVPNIMSRWCTVPEIWWATDGQTKKWHIKGGAPPKNFKTSKYQVMIHYKHFITSTLLDIGPKAFSERVEKQEFSAFSINFFENKKKLYSLNSIVYTPY